MLKELVTFISNETGLVIGSGIVAGCVSTESADTVVVVEELVAGTVDPVHTDVRSVPFRVLSRATSYWTARAGAYTVFDALHGRWHMNMPVVTSGELWEGCLEANTPYYIGPDDKGRHLFVFTVTVRIMHRST